MPKSNRICVVCGKGYHYCPTCREDVTKPRWMTMFDTENCKVIFDTATKFNLGKITAIEAQEQLKDCNLHIDFSNVIQQDLKNIFAVNAEPMVVEAPSIEEEQTARKSRKQKIVDEEVVIE